MFERFTDRARRVVVLAQDEARGLKHNYIGTEHLLLGLISEGEGVAAKALETMGIKGEAVRALSPWAQGRGRGTYPGPRPWQVRHAGLRQASPVPTPGESFRFSGHIGGWRHEKPRDGVSSLA